MVKVKIFLDCTCSLPLWYIQTNVFYGATTLVTTTFSITVLRIRSLFATLSKSDTHCVKNHDIMLSLLISKSICERYFLRLTHFVLKWRYRDLKSYLIISYHCFVSIQPSRPCLLQTDILLSRQIEWQRARQEANRQQEREKDRHTDKLEGRQTGRLAST